MKEAKELLLLLIVNSLRTLTTHLLAIYTIVTPALPNLDKDEFMQSAAQLP